MGKLKKVISIIIQTSNNYTLETLNELISKISLDTKNKYTNDKIANTIAKYSIINGNNIVIDLENKNKSMSFNILRRTIILNKLMQIEYPEQRSKKWFEIREQTNITASDVGAILGANKYEHIYNVIRKKVRGSTFKTNEACYHGIKYEKIASILYENINNVKLADFGLVVHNEYNFLGASPDAICRDTALIGRMVEIKCPLTRIIKNNGNIKGDICPLYYWMQVQLQLECCNLDECDFWQCTIKEYTRNEFINDIINEKGCILQILPLNNAIDQNIYENAKFIYPTGELIKSKSIIEWDKWIVDNISDINMKYPSYYLDKIIYWKLTNSNCSLIERDRKWFNESLPKLKELSEYITLLKKNKEIADKFFLYIDENEGINDEQAINKLQELLSI